MNNIGKTPPQAMDLENAILGALMLDQDGFSQCSSILTQECFYKEANQHVYKAIKNLYDKSNPVDILTVTEELKRLELLDTVGGAYYIVSLCENVASSGHIEYHSKIVKSKYVLREIIRKGSELVDKSYTDDLDNSISDVMNFSNSIIDILNTGSDIHNMSYYVDKSLESLRDRIYKYDNDIPIGIPTQIKELNRMLIGLMQSDLIILAARPSVGKSAVSLSWAKHQSSLGYSCAFFSMEMTAVSLVDRLIISESGVNAERYRSGRINKNDMFKIEKASLELKDRNFYIDDKPCVDVSYIKSKVAKLQKNGMCDIVYIDYLQIAKKSDKKTHEAIGEITSGLKQMAKDLNVPVVLLSQVNRDVSKRAGSKRPGMADLKDSGSIEQDADVIIFIHDPIKAGECDEFVDGEMLLIVAKQRLGLTGTVHVKTNESRTDYFDNDRYSLTDVNLQNRNNNGINCSFEQSNIDFDNEF